MTAARLVVALALMMIAFSPSAVATGDGECPQPDAVSTQTFEGCEEECPEPEASTQTVKDDECEEIPFFPTTGALVLGSLGAVAIAGMVVLRRRS